MIRYLSLFLISLFCLSCGADRPGGGSIEEVSAGPNADIIRSPISAATPADTTNLPRLQFEELVHDFGTVDEGAIVTHNFAFTNTGKTPLIIGHARSTCGCTIPEWPKEPIAPGEGGVIEVRFDTKNKYDHQEKKVTITANTYPSDNVVMVKGVVRKKES